MGTTSSTDGNAGRTLTMDVALASASGDVVRIAHILAELDEFTRIATINAQLDDGDTPLNIACVYGQHDAVELLLDCGAAIDAADGNGLTPLQCAVYDGHLAVTELLIERDATIDAQSLLTAVKNEHYAIVKLLLEHGDAENVNKLDMNERSPLYYAVMSRNRQLALLLLEYGARKERELAAELLGSQLVNHGMALHNVKLMSRVSAELSMFNPTLLATIFEYMYNEEQLNEIANCRKIEKLEQLELIYGEAPNLPNDNISPSLSRSVSAAEDETFLGGSNV